MRTTGAILLLTVVTCLAPCSVAQDQEDVAAVAAALRWERLAEMPQGVMAAAASRADRRAVITGGINQAGAATDAIQVYELDQDRWESSLKLHLGRCFHAQVTLPDGRILVAGGQTGQYPGNLRATHTAELIDLEKRQVTQLPNMLAAAGHATGHLLPDGRAIIIGGPRAGVFNPETGGWDTFIRLRANRAAHDSALLMDGRVIVVGGHGQASMEVVNPFSGFSRMLSAKLPAPRDDLRIAALPNWRVWIVGGQETSGGLTSQQTWIVDLSDSNRSVLEEGPSLNLFGGMADHCLGRVGRWLIAAGGESERDGRDVELADARLLDTRTLTVARIEPMTLPHDDAVAIVDGRDFIVFGGVRILPTALGQAQVAVPQALTAVERLRLPVE